MWRYLWRRTIQTSSKNLRKQRADQVTGMDQSTAGSAFTHMPALHTRNGLYEEEEGHVIRARSTKQKEESQHAVWQTPIVLVVRGLASRQAEPNVGFSSACQVETSLSYLLGQLSQAGRPALLARSLERLDLQPLLPNIELLWIERVV